MSLQATVYFPEHPPPASSDIKEDPFCVGLNSYADVSTFPVTPVHSLTSFFASLPFCILLIFIPNLILLSFGFHSQFVPTFRLFIINYDLFKPHSKFIFNLILCIFNFFPLNFLITFILVLSFSQCLHLLTTAGGVQSP